MCGAPSNGFLRPPTSGKSNPSPFIAHLPPRRTNATSVSAVALLYTSPFASFSTANDVNFILYCPRSKTGLYPSFGDSLIRNLSLDIILNF